MKCIAGAQRRRVIRAALILRDGMLCHWCREPMKRDVGLHAPERLSIDHVVARADGGTNDIDNLVLAHQGCNIERDTVQRYSRRRELDREQT